MEVLRFSSRGNDESSKGLDLEAYIIITMSQEDLLENSLHKKPKEEEIVSRERKSV